MIKTAIASSALFAAHALAAGSAIVINSCSYDVYLANTPSEGGGYNAIDQTLSSGATYSQQYTELSNMNGWSLKLSKDDSWSNILQYEYTFHNDGTIWYDLSDVNGNPWDGDWEITASGDCTPRQAAYRYSTDDAYGMQACPDTSSVTVTLCSGDGSGSGSAPPSYSSSPSQTSAAPTSYAAKAPSSPVSEASHSFGGHTWGLKNGKVAEPAGDAVEESTTSPSPSPTTLVTTASEYNGPAVTITNIVMATETAYVTATAAPAKRHEHHPRHPHHKN